jgi:hypothetical protein
MKAISEIHEIMQFLKHNSAGGQSLTSFRFPSLHVKLMTNKNISINIDLSFFCANVSFF